MPTAFPSALHLQRRQPCRHYDGRPSWRQYRASTPTASCEWTPMSLATPASSTALPTKRSTPGCPRTGPLPGSGLLALRQQQRHRPLHRPARQPQPGLDHRRRRALDGRLQRRLLPAGSSSNFRFADFTRKEIGNGVPNDGLTLTEVHGWAFGTLNTGGRDSYFIDEVGLYGVAETPALDGQLLRQQLRDRGRRHRQDRRQAQSAHERGRPGPGVSRLRHRTGYRRAGPPTTRRRRAR